MSEEIDVLIRFQGKFYEGKLKPQKVGSIVPSPRASAPIFPEPYAEMLTISEEGTAWIVRPRQFLGSENFSEIARIVRQYKGEYVSAGKSSYFSIPK